MYVCMYIYIPLKTQGESSQTCRLQPRHSATTYGHKRSNLPPAMYNMLYINFNLFS